MFTWGGCSVVSFVPIIQTLRLHYCWHCCWPHLNCGYTGKGPCCFLDIVSPNHQQKFTKVRFQDCNNGSGPAAGVVSTAKTVTWLTIHLNVPRKFQFSSVQFSHTIMSDSFWPHGLQHARLPCPSPTPRVYSNSCQWCHPAISSSVAPFSSCLQPFPVSRSFPMSQFFASGGQSIGVSALTSVLPWFKTALEWIGWTSLQSKGLSRVSSNTTVQKYQFLCAQVSLQANSHMHTWLLEKS